MGEESCNVGVVWKGGWWWWGGSGLFLENENPRQMKGGMLELSFLINKSDITFNNCVRTYGSFHKSNYRTDITGDTDKNIKTEDK